MSARLGRVTYRCCRATVLPASAYLKLDSFLRAPGALDLFSFSGTHDSVTGAAYLPSSHLNMITSHLYYLALTTSTLIPYLDTALRKEISSFADSLLVSQSTSPNTLFRGNSSLTKTMEFAMMHYGRPWLDKSLGSQIRRLISEKISLETDVGKIEKLSKREMADMSISQILEVNVRLLVEWCGKIWVDINNARDYCPKCVVRVVLAYLRLIPVAQ